MDDIVEHFTRFAAERRKMRGTAEIIHGMHSGEPNEIMLTLADLERAAATITSLRGALAECADGMEWATDRLVHVHGESPNVDFVLTLRERAVRARALLASTTEREA